MSFEAFDKFAAAALHAMMMGQWNPRQKVGEPMVDAYCREACEIAEVMVIKRKASLKRLAERKEDKP